MFEGIFLSKFVPSFSRNGAPPPTDHDDAGPVPDSKKYILYECRVCRKTIKLTTRDGKQKAVDHAIGHRNMFYYNCRVHECGAKYRKCHQIKYHHRKFHNSKKEVSLLLDGRGLRAIVEKSFGSKIMRCLCTQFTQKTKSKDKLLVSAMNKVWY
ncbi:hypothetical protein CAEBREN_02867 [Caenorhabditis brenneri]|uniref:C2H2-type domain-containing protein n=1 Tax=Caenorhabditis brenneri TaxID=135651 RepID=G0PG57_CAEBE|nr:hypothetical protein CAEBREN_02867 [Caenorhabditis brenneri]